MLAVGVMLALLVSVLMLVPPVIHAQGTLTAPTNVVATGGINVVAVTWTDGRGALGHLVFLHKSDFAGDPLQATADDGSHTFRDVPAGEYIVVVVAYDANGNQQPTASSVVTVIDPAVRGGLAAPTNVVARVNRGAVTVTWTDGQGALGHLVFLFRSDFAGDPLVATADGSSHTFRDVPPDGYIAVVVAYDANDNLYAISNIVTLSGAVSGPVVGKIYWTDISANKVQRANLDGSEVEDLVVSGARAPSGVAVDLDAGQLYWADFGAGRIQRINLDGDQNQSVVVQGLSSPAGMALDVTADRVYWAALRGGKIQRANLDGTGVEDLVTTAVRAPHGIALDVLGGKMYWTDLSPGKIQRANLDGTEVENLVTSLREPHEIALDISGGKMYWTDVRARKVQRANLDGTDVEDLVTAAAGLRDPHGIAVDILTDKVYWTDLRTRKIQRANLDGTGVEDVITTGLRGPENLIIDVATRNQATDFAALRALYTATGGHSWTNKDRWLTDAPLGEWHGVTTDGEGRVIRLDLDDNNLSGTLPAALANLTSLTHLYMPDNSLSGEIPPELGNLTNLVGLGLRGNDLEGTIPPELGNLSDLALLLLGENQLEGEIPRELGKLRNLLLLHLQDNQLTGPIPPDLGVLSGLIRLSLRDNQLTGVIPAALGNLTNLEGLWLYGNELSGKIPRALGDVAIRGTLQEAYLASNDDLTDCIPVGLEAVPENDFQDLGLPYCPLSYSSHMDANYLRNALTVFYNATGGPQGTWSNSENWLTDKPLGEWYGITTADELGENTTEMVGLDLRKNGLTGQLPGMLGYLRNLETLDLSDNELTGPIPANYGDLNTLLNLNLGGNQLTGLIPAELSNNYVLANLYLYRNQLTGEIPEQLGNLYGLRTLSLPRNQLTGRLPARLSRLANLRWLNLENNQLTGKIPPELGDLTELHGLGLGHNALWGELPEELGKLENLRELYLDDQNIFRVYSVTTPDHYGYYNNDDTFWLHGPIPDTLGELMDLEILDLSDNRLSEAIPDSLGSLDNLISLYLGDNRLSGTIPTALGNLSYLKNLDLGGNQLEGEIPGSLGSLPLIAVDLYYNNFDIAGCVPPDLVSAGAKPGQFGLPPQRCPTPGELTELEERVLADLYVRTNGDQWHSKNNWFLEGDQYFPPDNTWHGVHTNGEGRIIGLDLSDNNLNGTIGPLLETLPNLQWLRLYGNPLKGCIPLELKDKLISDQYAQDVTDEGGGLLKVLPETPGWVKTVVKVAAQSALKTAGQKTTAKWFPVGLSSTEKASDLLGEAIYNHNPGQLGLPLCRTLAPVPGVDVEQQTSFTDKATLLAIRDHYIQAGNTAEQFPGWEENGKRIGEWHGVQTRTINGQDRVTRISLDKRSLVGTIPSELGNLGELRFLNLSQNNLTGPIPAQLGNLVNLHTLALNDNRLSNLIEEPPIPKELSNLVRLEEFYLQNNQLEGVIPQELATLTYTSMRIMDVDRAGEHFLSGCLPPKDWGLGLDIRNAALGVSDAVTWTLLSGGIHGITKSSAQAAKAAGSKGVGISVPAGVRAFAPAFSTTFRTSLAASIKSHFPKMSGEAAEIIADHVEKEVINQMVKYGASNYTDGTVANLVSAFFGPVSKLSDEFAELFGSLGEFFGWYGLGGKIEMDKVYCPG